MTDPQPVDLYPPPDKLADDQDEIDACEIDMSEDDATDEDVEKLVAGDAA